MPASVRMLDDVGVLIPQGTQQIVSGQIPGSPSPFVTYQLENEGDETAVNVKISNEGRLEAAGGDYLARGVGYVDERALEIQFLDAVGGNATSGIQAIGFQSIVSVPDIAAGAVQVFRARINGFNDTPQTGLLLKVFTDMRSSPVGDRVGTGSGIYWGAGDGETTDSLSRSGSVTAAAIPDHTVQLTDEAWMYRGQVYQILAADLHTTVEDGAGAALSPADITQGYYIGLTLGDVVQLADNWSVAAGTAAVTAAAAGGNAAAALIGSYIHLAGELHEVLAVPDPNTITLHTNHAAGAAAQPAFSGWTVTKGLQVLLSARTDADRPALPVGEVYQLPAPAGQIFIWRPGDDAIPQSDITDTATAGLYSRSVAGLDVTIARGRSKVDGFEARTSTSDTITLPTTSTSLIQLNAPDDASITSTTDGVLLPGSMALYRDTTDGAAVTSSVDLRKYLGELMATAFFPDMTTEFDTGAPSSGLVVVANPLNAPMYIRPAAIRFELSTADPSTHGATSGAWVIDILILTAGVQASIFRSQGTDDRRPQIAFDATAAVAAVALHEQVKVPGGSALAVRLVEIPAGLNTDPSFGVVSWAWSPAG